MRERFDLLANMFTLYKCFVFYSSSENVISTIRHWTIIIIIIIKKPGTPFNLRSCHFLEQKEMNLLTPTSMQKQKSKSE